MTQSNKTYLISQLAFYKILCNIESVALLRSNNFDKIMLNDRLVGFYNTQTNKIVTKHPELITLLDTIITQRSQTHDKNRQIVFG